ncbi:SDR family NAD(P)-dependent oxidoreductase [Parasphingopyxis algicola]|uniref:SDR family NAD(P)-dependent oxidoreductase n=1 Tax=Parasphingopyxis algicola TaxID=2026624 RepID=UPI0015A2AD3E|nr:SDR family NAD(P)-dependent oxidoreductase [Parasphingopyxis algicola]QLC23575.1 SDR family NAD(P)-dependent oxidoreductase [Parasphingopyxis algicola]
MNYADLKGDWALVTGAADGIGLALAQSFAAAGAHIVLVDIRADALASARETLSSHDVTVRTETADVSERQAMIDLAERLAKDAIVPRMLWINAGVGAAARLSDGKERAIRWVYDVNLFGTIWTAQAFIPAMRARGTPSHIGVTASSATLVPIDGPFPLYAASKYATAAVAEALTSELKDSNIGVTILCPGLLNTGIWNSGRARPERFGGARELDDSAGEYWHKAMRPDVLAAPVRETVESGGGWCVVQTEGATRDAFEERNRARAAHWTDLSHDS